MIYLILIIAIMTAVTLCGCLKPGKNEGICKYDNVEDSNK